MKNNNVDVLALVVTYNRKDLLKENLEALLGQTTSCDVLVIDNASTDGTAQLIKGMHSPRVKYYNTKKNLGGAGGFSKGMKLALKGNYRYLWIMDDDSIPQEDSLQSLCRKAGMLEDKFSYMASTVKWTDGSAAIMNTPAFSADYRVVDLNKLCDMRLIGILASSFVGCFINTEYARKTALPIAQFFIYGDDVEYTSRLRRMAPAYLDLDSVVIHKMKKNEGVDVAEIDVERIDRIYYNSRNMTYIARKKGWVSLLRRFKEIIMEMKKISKIHVTHKKKRIALLLYGSIMGLIFAPRLRYPD